MAANSDIPPTIISCEERARYANEYANHILKRDAAKLPEDATVADLTYAQLSMIMFNVSAPATLPTITVTCKDDKDNSIDAEVCVLYEVGLIGFTNKPLTYAPNRRLASCDCCNAKARNYSSHWGVVDGELTPSLFLQTRAFLNAPKDETNRFSNYQKDLLDKVATRFHIVGIKILPGGCVHDIGSSREVPANKIYKNDPNHHLDYDTYEHIRVQLDTTAGETLGHTQRAIIEARVKDALPAMQAVVDLFIRRGKIAALLDSMATALEPTHAWPAMKEPFELFKTRYVDKLRADKENDRVLMANMLASLYFPKGVIGPVHNAILELNACSGDLEKFAKSMNDRYGPTKHRQGGERKSDSAAASSSSSSSPCAAAKKAQKQEASKRAAELKVATMMIHANLRPFQMTDFWAGELKGRGFEVYDLPNPPCDAGVDANVRKMTLHELLNRGNQFDVVLTQGVFEFGTFFTANRISGWQKASPWIYWGKRPDPTRNSCFTDQHGILYMRVRAVLLHPESGSYWLIYDWNNTTSANLIKTSINGRTVPVFRDFAHCPVGIKQAYFDQAVDDYRIATLIRTLPLLHANAPLVAGIVKHLRTPALGKVVDASEKKFSNFRVALSDARSVDISRVGSAPSAYEASCN